MKNKGFQKTEKGVFEIVDQAFFLIRSNPWELLFPYCMGTFPFILGLLWFWSFMSRNPHAGRYLVVSSWALCLLFVWMKYWQCIFGQGLFRVLYGENGRQGKAMRMKAILRQAAFQPTGFILLPLSLLLALPFGWTYAFYQSATIMENGEDSWGAFFKKCKDASMIWPMQNHIFLFLVSVFSGVVFINILVFMGVLPFLMKNLLGIETPFTMSVNTFLNTTFLISAFCITYLCVDPLIKTVYLMRAFYAISMETGDDIAIEIRAWQKEKALSRTGKWV